MFDGKECEEILLNENTAVLLFVFNRPLHTKKVIEGIKACKIKKLYVFSDGPRSAEERKIVEEVRELINEIEWCEVVSNFRESNIGLANSVINGVNSIFKNGYERVIVLEDDCVPSVKFIEFMNQNLDYYEDYKEVMHVSGFGLPIKKHTNKDNYFTPYPCSWGWGTWKKYWDECDFSQNDAYTTLLMDSDRKKDFNYAGEAFSEFLEMQLQGKVNSWLIRWYYHIFQENGRCVWAYESMIENNGFDGSGEHSNKIDRFNQKKLKKLSSKKFNLETNLQYSEKLIREFRRHFMGKRKIEKIKTAIYLLTGIIIGK